MCEYWDCYLAQSRLESPSTNARRRFWANFFSQQLSTWPPTRSDIEQLFWQPRSDGKFYSPHTVCQGLTMLRQFLRWAVAQGIWERHPFDQWTIGRASSKSQELLTRQQLQDILSKPAATPIGLRDRAILNLMAELGLSARALAALDLKSVSLDAHELNGQRLSALLGEHLQRYLRHGRPALLTDPGETALFLTHQGRRPQAQSIAQVLLRHAPHRIGTRVLHRSWLAHRQAFHSRHLPGI